MKAAILTIGDELLIGQVINTNSAWLASRLTEFGVDIVVQCTVGDTEQALVDELDRLRSTADWIITTGGLGPTHDDKTKDILNSYTNDTLALHQPSLENLRALLARRGRELTDRNALQAWLPSRCMALDNHIGTAPGMLFKMDDVTIVCLPGVPDEMKQLVNSAVIPLMVARLSLSTDPIWAYRTIHTAGIVESALADLLGDASDVVPDGTLAYLPSYHGVRLRVGVADSDVMRRGKRLDQAVKYIYDRADRFVIGPAPMNLQSALVQMLKESSATLSIAESCTGGMVSAAITSIPGSSAVYVGGIVAYDNRVKIGSLRVDPFTIDQHGAVSEEVARAMANGIRRAFGTDYALSTTGIAGPDGGTEEKPVGTVWIALATPHETIAKRVQLGEVRHIIQERAVASALTMLWQYMRAHTS